MQQLTQKYAIIQLFEDTPVGTMFTADNWPLHSTIVDTFAIDWDVHTMTEKLSSLLSDHDIAVSVAESDVFFGPNKEVHVTLLQKTDTLSQLHYDVVQLLKQGGWRPNDPQFAEQGFLPHATIQPHARLYRGNEVVFDTLSIVDFFPNGNSYHRTILANLQIIHPIK